MNWLKGSIATPQFRSPIRGEIVVPEEMCSEFLADLLDDIWYTVTGPRFERAVVNFDFKIIIDVRADLVRWYPICVG